MSRTTAPTLLLLALLLAGGCSDDDPTGPGGGGEPGTGVAYAIPPFDIVRHGVMLADVWSDGAHAVCVGERSTVLVSSAAGRFLLPVPTDGGMIVFLAAASTGTGVTYVAGRYAAGSGGDPALFRFEKGRRHVEPITGDQPVTSVRCASDTRTYAVTGHQLWRRIDGGWEVVHTFEDPAVDVFPAGSSRLCVAADDGLHTFDGTAWSLVHPVAHGYCRAVEGLDEDQIMAVVDESIVMQDATPDFELAYAAGVSLTDVDWAAADWAVASGREGTVVMHDGVNWSRSQVDFGGSLRAVAAWQGVGGSGALAVGENGAEFTYADGDWTGNFLPKGYWQDIAGDGQGRIFGLYTDTGGPEDRTILCAYDGATWEDHPYPGGMILDTLFCRDAQALWALGHVDIDNFVAHFDGADWSASWLSSLDTPRALWVAESRTVYVACDNGTVYVSGNPETAVLPIQHLRGIWGANAAEIYVVGENGTICRREGASAWKAMESGTTAHLNAVHGSGASHVVAVGEGGTALRYDGLGWTALDVGLAADLDEVWTGGPEDIWVASSAANLLVHYDGHTWRQIDVSPLGTGPRSVWTDGQEVWVSSLTLLARYAEPPSFAALLGGS